MNEKQLDKQGNLATYKLFPKGSCKDGTGHVIRFGCKNRLHTDSNIYFFWEEAQDNNVLVLLGRSTIYCSHRITMNDRRPP